MLPFPSSFVWEGCRVNSCVGTRNVAFPWEIIFPKNLKGNYEEIKPSRATSTNICLLVQLPTSLHFLAISSNILLVINFTPKCMSLTSCLTKQWLTVISSTHCFLVCFKNLKYKFHMLYSFHMHFFVYYLRNTEFGQTTHFMCTFLYNIYMWYFCCFYHWYPLVLETLTECLHESYSHFSKLFCFVQYIFWCLFHTITSSKEEEIIG